MDTLSYKTLSLPKEAVVRDWWVVDATGMSLGRLCSQVALVLRGKHKPSFTPHVNCGDAVIIINAEKVRLTGNKWDDKTYQYYTGYPGGQRELTLRELRDRNPARVLELAIRRMLPKNKLANDVFRNLHVYAGPEHPHAAQNPQVLSLKPR